MQVLYQLDANEQSANNAIKILNNNLNKLHVFLLI